jgi:hypothetical protein
MALEPGDRGRGGRGILPQTPQLLKADLHLGVSAVPRARFQRNADPERDYSQRHCSQPCLCDSEKYHALPCAVLAATVLLAIRSPAGYA